MRKTVVNILVQLKSLMLVLIILTVVLIAAKMLDGRKVKQTLLASLIKDIQKCLTVVIMDTMSLCLSKLGN